MNTLWLESIIFTGTNPHTHTHTHMFIYTHY